jgi:acetoin utilization deacetylase AcuC-like enzyme
MDAPRLILLSSPACDLHATPDAHAETPRRLPALRAALDADLPLRAALEERQPARATEADLLRVHTPRLLDQVRAAADEAGRTGAVVWVDADTAVSSGSYQAALAAAGCAIAAVEAAAAGPVPRTFSLARPPGHHATPDRAMGFCLFNNVAVAVRRAQADQLVERVLVVDWDAHHGNGTQDAFYRDPTVAVLSLHLGEEYPGTGRRGERGAGPGRGSTHNIPLPRGTGAAEYRRRHREALDRMLGRFSPDLVVISAGLDLLDGDPEGGLALEPLDLHGLASDLLARLPESARGRVAAVLEGGYALERIGPGLVQLLRGLAGLPPA